MICDCLLRLQHRPTKLGKSPSRYWARRRTTFVLAAACATRRTACVTASTHRATCMAPQTATVTLEHVGTAGTSCRRRLATAKRALGAVRETCHALGTAYATRTPFAATARPAGLVETVLVKLVPADHPGSPIRRQTMWPMTRTRRVLICK